MKVIPDNALATLHTNKPFVDVDRINKKIADIKVKNDKFNTELKKASVELETIHISQLLKEMRASLDSEADLFGDSLTKEFFTSALDAEYAKLMSNSGGIGIANMIIESNKRL